MYKTNSFHYGINVKKSFELPAFSQKSFYGKAKIIIDENNEIFLQSYDTLVCYINTKGQFCKLWDGYSVTTMKHINDFCKLYSRLYDMPTFNKKAWDMLETEKH